MTDITELAQRMKTAAEKATQGEWWADEVKNEGCYGSGDDCVEGFTSYAIYGSDGQTLFDSLNSDAACISEEYDGEGHVAWDETAQRNAEFIALANPANIFALVEALEKAQRANSAQGDHINQQQERIEQLEKGHRHAAKRINSWCRLAKQSIAEQEKCVDELDAARQRIVELDRKNCELNSLTQRWAAERAENAERIAELESRNVTVKLPDIMPPEAAPAHYWGSGESMAYADGYNKSAADLKTSFAQACSSAGVNVEFE